MAHVGVAGLPGFGRLCSGLSMWGEEGGPAAASGLAGSNFGKKGPKNIFRTVVGIVLCAYAAGIPQTGEA